MTTQLSCDSRYFLNRNLCTVSLVDRIARGIGRSRDDKSAVSRSAAPAVRLCLTNFFLDCVMRRCAVRSGADRSLQWVREECWASGRTHNVRSRIGVTH